MKKFNVLLLSAIVTLGSISSAFAGDDDKDKKKGIRAGWQSSNFYDQDGEVGNAYNSFYVGFFGEKKLAPILRLGSGLEYHSTGTVDKVLENTQLVRHTISIPVYLRVKVGPVYGTGGIAANFGVSDKMKLLGEDVDLTDEMKTKTFNLPAHLGIGVNILMLRVEARYHWGLMNLSKIENDELKNRYFQIGAAIAF